MKRIFSATSRRTLTTLYCLLQGTYWVISAAEMDYAATPLLRERGFSSISIGIISGAKFLSLIFFQYFIGRFADSHKDRISLKKIVSILTIIAIAADLALLFMPVSFVTALVVFIIFGGTVNCVLPLIEALSIDYMNSGLSMNYTLSRATGSLTYCVFAYLLGIWTGKLGMDFSLVFMAVVLVVFLGINLVMPKPVVMKSGNPVLVQTGVPLSVDVSEISQDAADQGVLSQMESPVRQVHSTGWILKNCGKYRRFLLECFFVFLGYDMNIAFLYDRVKDIGGTDSAYGLVFSMIGLFEIPVALGFYRLMRVRGITIERLMAFFGAFCTARAFFTTISVNMTQMVLTQAFELLGMGVFYAGSVFFVMKTVPEADSAKGMSLINLFAVGAAEAVAFFISGIIRDSLGVLQLMYISVLVSAIGVIVGLPLARKSREEHA
jgi:PPP family 3-phenylpropionic acid transporter